MNRREFLFNTGTVAVGFTMLSPLRAICLNSLAPLPISEQLAVSTPAWLKRFDGAHTSSLVKRRRFRLMIDGVFAGMSAPFWFDRTVYRTIRAYTRVPHNVTVQHHRFVIATGSMRYCAANRAILWIDTKFNPATSSVPRAVLAVIDVGTSGRNLWLLDNHVAVTGGIRDVPHNLRLNMRRWLRWRLPLNISENELLQRGSIQDRHSMRSRPTFRRLEGGLLEKITSLDRHLQSAAPEPGNYGIPTSRFEPHTTG